MRGGRAPAKVTPIAPMKIGKREIRTALELLDDEHAQKLDQGFRVTMSDDESIAHIECKETGARWTLPRLPASEQTEERLGASAKLVGEQLDAHLAKLAEDKKKAAAAKPS